jgi:membrane protein implicated in regulation of membrane protease activity
VILLGAILLAFFVLPPEWAIPVVFLGAVVEVGETLFWLWYSRRRSAQVGAETLIGELAEVVTRCAPVGQVRLQGEIWRARCEEGAERGERVRVTGLEELTLVVERAPAGLPS